MKAPIAFARKGRATQRLELGRLLGEGAAGKVYSVPARPGKAAKLYHPDKLGAAAEAKIEAMLARPPKLPPVMHEGVAYPQIAWPEEKLYNEAGGFIGFLMPEIDFGRSTSLVNLLQKSSRRAEGISDYYGYRVLVARNLASVFAQLHSVGHHMIDMKPANLRFYPSLSWMAVVDADGFSIAGKTKRIAADQLSDEYIAPESWQEKPAALGVEQDLFALGVIIFQLLNNGLHPFAGSGRVKGQATDLQGRILAGLYSYGLEPVSGAAPAAASIHKTFRRSTRMLFDRAFSGQDRPDAASWRDHLDGLVGMLIPCEAKPLEHAHFGSGCGFCAHEARLMSAAISRAKRGEQRARGTRLAPVGQQVAPHRGAGYQPVMAPRGGSNAHRRRKQARSAPAPNFRKALLPMLVAGGLIAAATATPWHELTPIEDAVWDNVATAAGAQSDEPFSQPVQASTDTPRRAALRESSRTMMGPTPGEMAEPATEEEAYAAAQAAVSAARNSLVDEGAIPRAKPATRDVSAGQAACANLTGWLDRRLCEQPRLAAVDQAITVRFQQLVARSDATMRQLLYADQQRWHDARDLCVLARKPVPCLDARYQERLADLSDPEGV